MNLIDFGFQNSNLFRHMPLFDEISYLGHNEGKIIANLIPTSIEFIPEVYIQDKNGVRELLSGCKL